jgi:hypothetical protein
MRCRTPERAIDNPTVDRTVLFGSRNAVEEGQQLELLHILHAVGLKMLDVRPFVVMFVPGLSARPVLDKNETSGIALIDEQVVSEAALFLA